MGRSRGGISNSLRRKVTDVKKIGGKHVGKEKNVVSEHTRKKFKTLPTMFSLLY